MKSWITHYRKQIYRRYGSFISSIKFCNDIAKLINSFGENKW